MNKPIEPTGDKLTARRRFVRNSAVSVPVVLTLRSGAASAQAMASQACAIKDAVQAVEFGDRLPVFSENDMEDSFLRVGVLLRQLVEVGDNDNRVGSPFYVYRQDMEPPPELYWTADNPQLSCKDVEFQGNDKQLFMTIGDDSSRKFAIEEETRAYGLVVTDLWGIPQMTDDGQLRVGRIEQDDLTNITVSCMTSISPDMNIQL